MKTASKQSCIMVVSYRNSEFYQELLDSTNIDVVVAKDSFEASYKILTQNYVCKLIITDYFYFEVIDFCSFMEYARIPFEVITQDRGIMSANQLVELQQKLGSHIIQNILILGTLNYRDTALKFVEGRDSYKYVHLPCRPQKLMSIVKGYEL